MEITVWNVNNLKEEQTKNNFSKVSDIGSCENKTHLHSRGNWVQMEKIFLVYYFL